MRVSILRKHLSYSNVMATLAVFIVLGGGAYAATQVSAGNNVISGCYNAKTGALRVISRKKHCRSNERALTWNQRGIQGLPGIQGAKGSAGAKGGTGAKGAAGTQGAAGNAKGWGLWAANALQSHSSSVTAVTNPATGIYCIAVTGALPATDSITVTPYLPSDVTTASTTTLAEATTGNAACSNSAFQVATFKETVSAGAIVNIPENAGFEFIIG